ncbi:MAG: hypothetical protein WCO69_04315 [Candidatus Omnitrophota bacterium]
MKSVLLGAWFFLMGVFCAAAYAVPVVDQARGKEIARLEDQRRQAQKALETPCHFDVTRTELPSTDPYSTFRPHMAVVSFEGHEVFRVTEGDGFGVVLKNGRTPRYEPPVYDLDCRVAGDRRYLFWQGSGEVCVFLKKCENRYFAVSQDRGLTWSGLESPKETFRNFSFLGKGNEAIPVGELSTGGNVLFDVYMHPLAQKLGVSPLYYYQGKVYLVEQQGTSGHSQLSVSGDGGRQWRSVPLPGFINAAMFFEHQGGLYAAYASFCSAFLKPCGELRVAKVSAESGFNDISPVLKDSAGGIEAVFGGDKPVIVWSDLRFYRGPHWGIPWSDSPTFTVKRSIFAGHWDMEKRVLDEGLIKQGDTYGY